MGNCPGVAMARRLQSSERSRAPDEENALPQVASDPVVQRSLRPESPTGRAGAAAAERTGDSFGTLLETTASPRPGRIVSHAHSSNGSDGTQSADDGKKLQPEIRVSQDPSDLLSIATAKNCAKVADGQ